MEYPNYDGELKQKIQECLDEKMVGVLQRYAAEAEKAIIDNRERLCKYPNCEIVNFRLDKHPAFGNRGYFVDIIEHP